LPLDWLLWVAFGITILFTIYARQIVNLTIWAPKYHHAGLSAAATLYRHQHSMLIFDDGKPRNRWKTVTRVISGGEGLDPEKLVRKARREIAVTGFATTLNRTIVTVRRQNNSLFEVTDTFGETWYGRKLLLATGAQFFFPEIPGYEENFPNKM
jgi:thioredoxin reductase